MPPTLSGSRSVRGLELIHHVFDLVLGGDVRRLFLEVGVLAAQVAGQLQHGFLGRRRFLDLFFRRSSSRPWAVGQEKGARRQQDRGDGSSPEHTSAWVTPWMEGSGGCETASRPVSFIIRFCRPISDGAVPFFTLGKWPRFVGGFPAKGRDGQRSSYMACSSFALGARPVIIEIELLEGRAVVVRRSARPSAHVRGSRWRTKASPLAKGQSRPPPANRRPARPIKTNSILNSTSSAASSPQSGLR